LFNKNPHHLSLSEAFHLPVVALVGYTNAGKSTLMNTLSHAGVFAENMLFATLDPTTRKITLPKVKKELTEEDNDPVISTNYLGLGNVTHLRKHNNNNSHEEQIQDFSFKGQELFLTDTVGFISKLPTNLIAAFRYFVFVGVTIIF
jgi:50S ribosomal subunit-associated GTPase HflX